MSDYNFLQELLEQPSVAGCEEDAIKVFEQFVQPFSRTYRDNLNNCYAVINEENKCKIMIGAHIDEIGFQITYIDKDGYLYVRPNGGIDYATIIGSQVIIQTNSKERLVGVIGKRPIHVQTPDERKKVPEIDDIWIDTGLSSEEVIQIVSVGDYVSIMPNFVRLGANRFSSKGLDNKVSVYVMAQVLLRLSDTPLNCCVCGVATTQEELGCKGAKVVGSQVKPDFAFLLDVGFSSDTPNMSPKRIGAITLGEGVVVTCHSDCSRELVSLAETVAHNNGIKFQKSANYQSTGGTDAPSVQLSGLGIKTLLLSIPNRYMHTQVEMCDMRDLEAAIELLVQMIIQIDNK